MCVVGVCEPIHFMGSNNVDPVWNMYNSPEPYKCSLFSDLMSFYYFD